MALRSILSVCLCGTVLLSACAAQYPLGMTEEEWKALPEDKKLEVRLQQSKLDEAERERRAADKKQKAIMEQKQEMARLAYINRLHSEGRYGDLLQCVIRDPLVDFHPGWRKAIPLGFTIAKSEVKSVTLADQNSGRTAQLWVKYSRDGMQVTLCRHEPTHGSVRGCDVLTSTSAGFMIGKAKSINLPDLMRGTIDCAYAPGENMPRRVIIHQQ